MFFFTCTSTDSVVSASMPTLSTYPKTVFGHLQQEEAPGTKTTLSCRFTSLAQHCLQLFANFFQEQKMSTLQIGILYAIAPIMAIVSVSILSVLLKRVGLRAVSILSCLCMLVGTIIFILLDGNYVAMMLGRGNSFFGLGPKHLCCCYFLFLALFRAIYRFELFFFFLRVVRHDFLFARFSFQFLVFSDLVMDFRRYRVISLIF
jgi:multidrug transporter EmrE-like cation transporter